MASDVLILGFDTSAAHCAAALLCGTRIIASRAENMSRGQAERLMPLLQEMLAGAGAEWRDLTAIGVGVGPGNFTGIRISVSAARGLALGLSVPAVGVSTLEAHDRPGILPAVAAPREHVYIAPPNGAPALLPLAEAQKLAGQLGLTLDAASAPRQLTETIARIAGQRWQTTTEPPAPLYIRPADAAPSRDTPPVLLD